MGRSMIWVAALAVLGVACPSQAFAADANGAPKAGPPSQAETEKPGTDKADESFHAGRALLKDKRYADACPKFEESQRQDPASGTLLALAYCQELSGLLATSWANYLAASQLAEREGHSDRQAAANERAQALADRLSRLTVVVPQELLSLPGFHVTRDGIEFERASFGVPVPMDGGTHAFVAVAPNRAPWSSTVTLYSERDRKTLVLPILDPVQDAASGAIASNPPLLAHTDRTSQSLRSASLALAAGSIVGLAFGTGLALSAQSKNDQSNDGHCTASACDARGIELRHSALSAARASTWSFVAAGALAAGSITLYVASSPSSTANANSKPNSASLHRAARIEGTLSFGAPSVFFSGSF